jgi:hypothetical protein
MRTTEAHELALQKWARRAVAPFDAIIGGGHVVEVIYERPRTTAGQSTPRPRLPYVSIALLSDIQLGARVDARLTDEVLGSGFRYQRDYHREGTLGVVAYGDRHRELMRAIEDSLDDPAQVELSDADGIIVSHSVGGLLDSGVARDTLFEEQTASDFLFRYRRQVDSELDAIETVDVTQTINDP